MARAVLHCFIGKSYHTQVRHSITPSPQRRCIVQKWVIKEFKSGFKQKLSITLPPLMLFHYSTLRWVDWQLLQPMRAFYSGHPASVHSVNKISYSADSNGTQLSLNGSPMLLEVFLLSYPVFHCLLTWLITKLQGEVSFDRVGSLIRGDPTVITQFIMSHLCADRKFKRSHPQRRGWSPRRVRGLLRAGSGWWQQLHQYPPSWTKPPYLVLLDSHWQKSLAQIWALTH